MDKSTIADILKQMREARREVRGDGFSKAGSLISAYKRVITAMERLQEVFDMPDDPVQELAWRSNPKCFGFAEHNVETCECKEIYRRVVQLVEQAPD